MLSKPPQNMIASLCQTIGTHNSQGGFVRRSACACEWSILRVTRMQSLAGQFEQLALGPGGPPAPGQPPEMATDPGQYPRPLRPGSGDAPPPFDQHSCRPAFMRMTVNAIPSSQALKARRGSGSPMALPSLGVQHACSLLNCTI